MTTTKAICRLLFATGVFLTAHLLWWAARVWGVEAVALFLALPALTAVGLALWAAHLERKRDAEPWVEIPWEARR